MSIIQRLTENIVDRDLRKEGASLLNKWEKTGLLEGLDNERERDTMSRLLENQAKELLREASSMAGGDVEGFAAVAFPIVRRVFGGLIANKLVSVQPMSLPSGLIFFLDFTKNDVRRLGEQDSDGPQSIYGGLSRDGNNAPVVGSMITGGINLATTGSGRGPGSFYGLGGAYSSPTGSTPKGGFADNADEGAFKYAPFDLDKGLTAAQAKQLQWDPDLMANADLITDGAAARRRVAIIKVKTTDATSGMMPGLDVNNLSAIGFAKLCTDTGLLADSSIFTAQATLAGALGGGTAGTAAVATHNAADYNVQIVRRLTRLDPDDSTFVLITIIGPDGSMDAVGVAAGAVLGTAVDDCPIFEYPRIDTFGASTAIGSVIGSDPWGLELATNVQGQAETGLGQTNIPEIDIKVDSVAVTAQTKKLKAKWSPELGQDLNAYHNLDAEVELTSILSEQIALEIDREILGDLVKGATGKTLYWSRSPGKFVKRTTGADLSAGTNPPDFTGNVSEWYETLIETVNEVSAHIHRKTLRGGANFVVTSPEVANILEFTAGFRASVVVDEVKGGSAGAIKVGNVSKKWDIYVDPYFPRNLMLVGRKGSSFLESGYVYAPYVPLQVTPTIFQPEDFTPRKGVMTRYAKKMVRPDMYGLVVVTDLLG